MKIPEVMTLLREKCPNSSSFFTNVSLTVTNRLLQGKIAAVCYRFERFESSGCRAKKSCCWKRFRLGRRWSYKFWIESPMFGFLLLCLLCYGGSFLLWTLTQQTANYGNSFVSGNALQCFFDFWLSMFLLKHEWQSKACCFDATGCSSHAKLYGS